MYHKSVSDSRHLPLAPQRGVVNCFYYFKKHTVVLRFSLALMALYSTYAVPFSSGPGWGSLYWEESPPWSQAGLLNFAIPGGEKLLSQAPVLALPAGQLGKAACILKHSDFKEFSFPF